MRKRAPGFTLVEILVTTAMFSMLVAAALSVFSAGTRSSAKARRFNEMVAHGQTALDAMAADIRAAVAQGSATVTALDAQYEGRDCNTIDLVIARTNPDRKEPDEGGRAAVGYYINNDTSVGPVGLFRREDRKPGEDLLSGGQVAAIAPGVSELKLEFFDGMAWVSGWSNDQGFPKAVRISVVVLDETRIENPLSLTTTVSVMAQ